MKIKSHKRLIELNQLLKRKSCFLFGPRQTGKSWLIKQQLQRAKKYDLLDVETFRALSYRPSLLEDELSSIKDEGHIAVIDEIQLLPELLNEVHKIIEQGKIKFLLTGSSARSLKRKGVNLLGGRASWKNLYPLSKNGAQRGF